MVKLDYFNIQLQNTSAVFRPGDTVAGTISYRIAERVKINQVRIEAAGGAHVHWTESHSNRSSMGSHSSHMHSHTHTDSYTASEEYFKFQQAYETKTGNADFYLEAGDYSHPFQFVLPPVLPSSVEHRDGRIRYSLVGTIDIPWSINRHCEQLITVVGNVDLNAVPRIGEPAQVSQSKSVCCLCCKSEPINITLGVRKGGYVAGETLLADVGVQNPTSRDISAPQLGLRQVLHLYANGRSKTEYRMVTSVQLPRGIAKNSEERFTGVELVIPQTSPSTLNASRIITVTYELTLTVFISGPSLGCLLQIPVVIGTVPLGSGAGRGGGGGYQQQQQQQQPSGNNWSNRSVQPNDYGYQNPQQQQQPIGQASYSNNPNIYRPQNAYMQDYSMRY